MGKPRPVNLLAVRLFFSYYRNVPDLLTAASLRRDLSARNLDRAHGHPPELTFGQTPSVVYTPDPAQTHGNFLPASYRRILANPAWSARLAKTYTASARIGRRHDRAHRSELDCASSSDALLMNVFCFPGILRRPAVLHLLGLAPGLKPSFGVRATLPVTGSLPDRTELDLVVGDLILESKLTETGFGQARAALVTRYRDLPDVFHTDDLPRSATGSFAGYQLLRSVLAAHATGNRFALLADARRADLHEAWFQVLRAVRSADLRSRLLLLTWQELARALPPAPQHFLSTKYGIQPI